MNKWNARSDEIAYLMNPAFTGMLIYLVINEYLKQSKDGFHFSLIYLVLPILMHKKTRGIVNSRSNMVKCIHENQELIIDFPKRVNSLIDFTHESIEFLLSRKIIAFFGDKIKICQKIASKKLTELCGSDKEIKECFLKAANLARWFFNMKTEENIYIAWGIRP